jgi:two-component system, cell cycle sensor histidine kinase and response regulator CckA
MTPEPAPSDPMFDRFTDSIAGPQADAGHALRRRAEALAGENAAGMPEDPEALSPEAARRALHELRVHQIELEMQNEELRRTQVDLEFSRERYFDLYDLAPVGYLTLSEKGLILEANLTAAKLFGVPRGALVQHPLSRFVFPEDQDTHYRYRKLLLDTGSPQSWEVRLQRGGAALFWARLEATAAQGPDGASVYRVVLSDITERRLEDEDKARTEARFRQLQKVEVLGHMAGAIAHHFNNHLTAVMGNLELALEELRRGSVSAERLTDAFLAARDAAEVSGLLLTYLGQTRAHREPLDLSEVCRRSLPLLRAAMPKDMVLDSELPSPGPSISANANQLQQVLTNLVTNAWEAAVERGGVVRLAVKTVLPEGIPGRHRFPIDWQPDETIPYACIEVADQGSGIAAQSIENLFDPFFSNKFTGRGLGLSVVLGIAKAHGGAVTVETAPSQGSTFRVFLPMSAGNAAR